MSSRPVTTSRPTAAVTPDRLIELEWVLDHEPDPRWVGTFMAVQVPRGGLVGIDLRPAVVGGSIRVAVHDDDVETVRAWVDASIQTVNQQTAGTA